MTKLNAEILRNRADRADRGGEYLQIRAQPLDAQQLNAHLHQLGASACEGGLVAVDRLLVIQSDGQQAVFQSG